MKNIKVIQIVLLVLIVIGIGLLATQKYWVDPLVGFILKQSGENISEDDLPVVTSLLTETEAREIAENSCIKGMGALEAGLYNEGTKTWWFDANLNSTREGCNPACVVSEETKQAEINWRCTGAIPEEEKPTAVQCLPEQRNVDVCNEIYAPVCATVEIQCIKAPCEPIQETFPNSCHACKNSLVKSYVSGECVGTSENSQ